MKKKLMAVTNSLYFRRELLSHKNTSLVSLVKDWKQQKSRKMDHAKTNTYPLPS